MRKLKRISAFILLILMMTACKNENQIEQNIFLKPKYAKGFIVYHNEKEYNVNIRLATDTAENILSVKIPKQKIKNTNKIACFSSTHIAFCKKIERIDNIIGIPDVSYFANADILQYLDMNIVRQITLGANTKNEVIINLAPDFVLTSSYQDMNETPLSAAGMTVLPILEYLETNALGRAEWIKLFGLLFDETDKAISIFKEIENRYKQLVISVEENSEGEKPTICDFMEYHGYWYASGGQSYIANLYKDAGFDYIYKDNMHSASFPTDIETALIEGSKTDYWRMVTATAEPTKIEDINKLNENYKHFKAMKTGRVICCNTMLSPYYIEDVVEPDIVLQDLINARLGKNQTKSKYYKLAKL